MFSIGPFSRYRFSESDRTSSKAPGRAAGNSVASATGAGATRGTSAGIATVTGVGAKAAKGTTAGIATVSGVAGRAARGIAAGSSTAVAIVANAARGSASGTSTAIGAGSTAWDLMLSEADAPIAYFAEIEPWVLTDRS